MLAREGESDDSVGHQNQLSNCHNVAYHMSLPHSLWTDPPHLRIMVHVYWLFTAPPD